MAIFIPTGTRLTGASNAGEVGKNRDSRPTSGFGFGDWWSIVNNFYREVICNGKRGCLFMTHTATYQWILFMTGIDEYAEENRT